MNLLAEFPGKSGKGDAFPIALARARAARMRLGGEVVLLGRHVARAFGAQGAPFLEWFDLRGAWAAVVPHPSGVNHWWNDPANTNRAAVFLAGLL